MDEGEPVAQLSHRLAQGRQSLLAILFRLLLRSQHRLDAGQQRQPARPHGREKHAGVGLVEEHVEVDSFRWSVERLRLELHGVADDGQPFAQGQPVDEFHGQPGDAFLLAAVQHAHDVRVVQRAQRGELALQARQCQRIRARRQHLERDRGA